MNESLPANQHEVAIDPVVVYQAIGLFLLATISGSLVFLMHQLAWPWFAVSFFVGAFSGVIVGAMFGVPLNSTVAAMAAIAGLLEGAYQGWQAYGLLGAVVGGPAGILASVVLVMLTLMSISAVVILCGGNPFVNAYPEESSGGDVERPT
ncbi:MAG: hypothetical protein JSS49_10815 [Planctomycetes bacterium]|nr:hypothetical protein [Planctomycetota bacterium]